MVKTGREPRILWSPITRLFRSAASPAGQPSLLAPTIRWHNVPTAPSGPGATIPTGRLATPPPPTPPARCRSEARRTGTVFQADSTPRSARAPTALCGHGDAMRKDRLEMEPQPRAPARCRSVRTPTGSRRRLAAIMCWPSKPLAPSGPGGGIITASWGRATMTRPRMEQPRRRSAPRPTGPSWLRATVATSPPAATAPYGLGETTAAGGLAMQATYCSRWRLSLARS